ncbi:TolC family protein [Paenirhodobacter enshiensis]|uniref:TolC family protein n=1 Tax=Paenirhodobacter enshiensis TaxID=1105367 RepID=UPI00068B0980|nr:TolC family protein [Paenirhodobacter enshiensis]
MRLIPLLAGTVACLAMLATEGAAMSYRDALRAATEYDAGVAALRKKVSRATTDIASAKDAWFPSVSFAAETNNTATGGPKALITLSQVLFDWGLIRSKVSIASYDRVKAVAKLKSSVEELAYDIAQQFLTVETMDRKLVCTEQYAAFARRIAGYSQDRVNAGIADSAEIARARLEIARAEDQLAQIQADRQMALAQIEYLIGKTPDSVDPLPDLGFSRLYGSSSAIISAVIVAPDYISAKADVSIAEKNVDKARASRLPTISIQAQGKQALNGERAQSGSIGVAASMDLDAGDFRGRALTGAKQDLEAAQSSLLSTERDLQNKVRTSVLQIQVLQQTEVAQENQLNEADKVLETYEQQFVAGKRELVDLLSTGRDHYDAQISTIDTYNTLKQTEYQAAQSIGVLGSLVVRSGGGKRAP